MSEDKSDRIISEIATLGTAVAAGLAELARLRVISEEHSLTLVELGEAVAELRGETPAGDEDIIPIKLASGLSGYSIEHLRRMALTDEAAGGHLKRGRWYVLRSYVQTLSERRTCGMLEMTPHRRKRRAQS